MTLPPQNALEILGSVGGSQKPQNLSIKMYEAWLRLGGGVQRKNPFHGGGMDNFWNHTKKKKIKIK